MPTTIYFIRHCEADNTIAKTDTRPLTSRGWADRETITRTLEDIHLDRLYSSPYKRTLDTIGDLAQARGMDITVEDGLHERVGGSTDRELMEQGTVEAFVRKQWQDMEYTLGDCESLGSTQRRNVEVILRLLKAEQGKTIAVATHGCALSCIANYFEPELKFDYFMYLIPRLPCIVRVDFDGTNLIAMEELTLKRTI